MTERGLFHGHTNHRPAPWTVADDDREPGLCWRWWCEGDCSECEEKEKGE